MQLKTKTKRFFALLLTVGMLFAAGCGGAPGEGTLSGRRKHPAEWKERRRPPLIASLHR